MTVNYPAAPTDVDSGNPYAPTCEIPADKDDTKNEIENFFMTLRK